MSMMWYIAKSRDWTRQPHKRGKEQSTKYLVGTLDRFNDGKKAEEADRVKHTV